MGRNPERDARVWLEKKQSIVTKAYKVYAREGIRGTRMDDIAAACKIGIATLYRYFPTKNELVLATAAWAWEHKVGAYIRKARIPEGPADEMLETFLDLVLELLRKQPDTLRFLQYFQMYARNERLLAHERELRHPFIEQVREKFQPIYQAAEKDGTLHTNISEEKAFACVMNTATSLGSRICAGLPCVDGQDKDEELAVMKRMIMLGARNN